MGGAVSSGRNNDDLIDNLLEADYIKSSSIERVFRAVDRAEYFLADARGNAYKDLAWKSGNLHISAPCIYSEVMEGLQLKPGASFLNLGSGTGYLSTMVGLILGTNGINHGIEIHGDVIEYANRKLDDFKKFSGAIDEYDFCEPKFVQGNCLCLTSESTAFYDRIYCGAACPEQFENYMRNLLKIGGILVMPINDQLLQIRRVSQTEWKSKTLLPVSFASLVMPSEGFQDFVKPIEVEPLSLQVLCRALVRNILRKNIEKEHPPVKRPPLVKVPKKKRALKKLVVPLFDDEESSDDERRVRLGGERNRDAGRAVFRRDDDSLFREEDSLFSFFWGIRNRHGSGTDKERDSSNRKIKVNRSKQEAMETDSNVTEETSNTSETSESTSHQVRAVIEHHPEPERIENHRELQNAIVTCLDMLINSDGEDPDEDDHGIERTENKEKTSSGNNGSENNQENAAWEDGNLGLTVSDSKPGTSTITTKRNVKREKFDSGLGDEIIEAQDSSDEEDNMKLDAISSCDEEYTPEKRYKKVSSCLGSSSETEDDQPEADGELRMYQSPYTEYMRAKIQQLPLPPILKRYLNFYRDIKSKEE